MIDFTLDIYVLLLKMLLSKDYIFQTFENFMVQNKFHNKRIVLRHDVDRTPENALKMAKIENALNIKASYFFRVVPNVWNEEIIKKIVRLGHEVGYHYEDLTLTAGDFDQAIKHFEMQLRRIREIYPCKTICMHGSPLSKFDNREIWRKYDYKIYGIIAEPYFDVNYTKVLYITDTGRAWNKNSVNVRDKVISGFDIKIKDTQNMIQLFNEDKMPNDVIINTHPHRWYSSPFGWVKELVSQNTKNLVKKLIVK